MRALVIYESMFGNTELVARAVADGLAEHLSAEVMEVSQAPTAVPGDVMLLAAGGPTHAFGMSRVGTRKSAADQAGAQLVSRGSGLREWLAGLAPREHPCIAATFDTRMNRPRLPGSAARGAAKQLRRKGFDLPARPSSFYVTGSSGPLVAGEIERAREWGRRLAREIPNLSGD